MKRKTIKPSKQCEYTNEQNESLIAYLRNMNITNYRAEELFRKSNGVITITITLEN